MSGSPIFPHGNQGRHFEAARDWLAKAEAQFADDQEILAAATLLLARAELKLLVEGVESGAAATETMPRSRVSRHLPFARTILGAAALAACFLFGMVLGRGLTAPAMLDVPGEIQSPAVQIAEVPEITPSDVPAMVETVEEEIVSGPPEIEESVDEEVTPAEAEPAPRPVYRPRRTAQPAETPSPVETPVPVEASTPEPVETQPAGDTPEADSTQPSGEISAAEVALRTIRALSERLINGSSE